jgi:heat shock protein HspQ
VAYVSEQNLLPDPTGPVGHPEVAEVFGPYENGFYEVRRGAAN